LYDIIYRSEMNFSQDDPCAWNVLTQWHAYHHPVFILYLIEITQINSLSRSANGIFIRTIEYTPYLLVTMGSIQYLSIRCDNGNIPENFLLNITLNLRTDFFIKNSSNFMDIFPFLRCK